MVSCTTGTTESTNFPTTAGVIQTTRAGPGFGGYPDGFVSKLAPDGR